MIDLKVAFAKAYDDFLLFEKVENKLHRRRDLCAFLMLDKLLPAENERDMISAAEHDEFWLDIDCQKLAEVATEDDILDLHRCGVRYDDDTDSLAMYA